MINNNLSDYLVKTKYGKVLQTALCQQNHVVFLSSKRGVSTPESPLGVPLNVTTFQFSNKIVKRAFVLKITLSRIKSS